ncbi:hypothetical protein [Adhaeribacter rhizoryzae]|uniref:Uncharacterized protein n=1 Tax=Adhaeribacter rhizoryzae TaxID=2607907 RepID=A0A5M6DUW5_9BACT|nr:hypothetical protein [Adhaeribacter rhizoryzae]KAA5549245.1 hypothetical protein F0145_01225 [Adhaeribacter rhizoryzae]
MLVTCHGKTPSTTTQAATGTITNQQPVITPGELPRKEIMSQPTPNNRPDRIAPGSCRLQGEIIAVLPTLEPNKNTPCGKVPCQAVVKVQRVLGYGSAFDKPLASGQEINVYFHFTLSPSARYFSELTKPLPGLKVGNIFQADMNRASDGITNKEGWFQVYSYTVIK